MIDYGPSPDNAYTYRVRPYAWLLSLIFLDVLPRLLLWLTKYFFYIYYTSLVTLCQDYKVYTNITIYSMTTACNEYIIII